MDTPRVTIWGTSTPRSFRPLWMAEELGIQYEHKPIGPRTGETQTPEYQQLNRKQKIPFMQDGDVKLSESLAICRYLRDQYPSEQVLTPKDLVTRAKEDEWCCYIYGESETTVNASRAYAEKHFEVVGQLLEKRPYLVGDQFGLADLFLMSCIDWANAYQVALPDRLHAYHAHIAERPAYMRAMKLNYPDLFGGN
jgi:glutathione S-transferase